MWRCQMFAHIDTKQQIFDYNRCQTYDFQKTQTIEDYLLNKNNAQQNGPVFQQNGPVYQQVQNLQAPNHLQDILWEQLLFMRLFIV